jgi:hypothetical protein
LPEALAYIMSVRISPSLLSILLLASASVQAFTIEKYRLGMSRKEAAAIGLFGCQFIQPKNEFQCVGKSDLKDVRDVEITVDAKSNKVTEIRYWVSDKGRYNHKAEIIQYLSLATCPIDDISPLFSGSDGYRGDKEFCLDGADRVRQMNVANLPRSKYRMETDSSQPFWVVSADYSPETVRLQRKEISKKREIDRKTKAFNDSLR